MTGVGLVIGARFVSVRTNGKYFLVSSEPAGVYSCHTQQYDIAGLRFPRHVGMMVYGKDAQWEFKHLTG
jgi:hypothetical protein